ncbi:MAG: type II secretion system F family protein, partial [Sphingorhabdus sp.]|nr:type II secretion system F family protein [Sphingorhabdus sp.]
MPEFSYHAIDPDGRERLGRISAANDDLAREALASKKLYIVSVAPAEVRISAFANLPLKRQPRLNAKQLTLFTRQLSSLAQVSPLEEALRTISRQSEQQHVRHILTAVHTGVVEGQRLSDAMRRESNSFPP